jgi:hypothetical protein
MYDVANVLAELRSLIDERHLDEDTLLYKTPLGEYASGDVPIPFDKPGIILQLCNILRIEPRYLCSVAGIKMPCGIVDAMVKRGETLEKMRVAAKKKKKRNLVKRCAGCGKRKSAQHFFSPDHASCTWCVNARAVS